MLNFYGVWLMPTGSEYRHMEKLEIPNTSEQVRAAIEKSANFSRELYRLQPETISFPPLANQEGGQLVGAATMRLRLTVSSALFSLALDHHVALVLLLRNDMRSSAFALLRAIFDAVWRGAWAAYEASESKLDDFFSGRYDPKPVSVIRLLEERHGLAPVLSRIYAQGWSTMSAFTHGGSLQVQRWIGDAVIEPRHSDAELCEVLDTANRLAFTACVLLLDVAGVERDDLTKIAEQYLDSAIDC